MSQLSDGGVSIPPLSGSWGRKQDFKDISLQSWSAAEEIGLAFLGFSCFFENGVGSFVFATSVDRVDWSALCELCCSLCAGDPPRSLRSAGFYFGTQNWQSQWKPCVTKVSCLSVSKRPIDPTVLAICSSSLGPLVPVTYL